MIAKKYGMVLGLSICLLGVGTGAIALTTPKQDSPAPTSDVAQSEEAVITVEELLQGTTQPVLLIDVRRYDEYVSDRIATSPLVPLSDIEAGVGAEKIQMWIEHASLTTDEVPTVVLYCSRGSRSGRAQEILAASGIETVNLVGGLQAWRSVVSPEQDADALNF